MEKLKVKPNQKLTQIHHQTTITTQYDSET